MNSLGSHDSNFLVGHLKSSTITSNKSRRDPNEELFDGHTASELIESVQQAALQARERLQSSRRPTYLSYLEETNDQGLVLCSIIDNLSPNTMTTISKNLNSHNNNQPGSRIIKPLTFDYIYRPTESGRIDVSVLTSNSSILSTNTTINTSSLNLSHTTLTTASNSITTSVPITTAAAIETSFDINDNDSKDETGQSMKTTTTTTTTKTADHQANGINNAIDNEKKDDSTKSSVDNKLNEIEEKEKFLKELIEELQPCYGSEEFGLDYALSIAKFARNSEYTFSLVTSLLSVLTDNKHRIFSSKFHRLMQEQFDGVLPQTNSTYSNTPNG